MAKGITDQPSLFTCTKNSSERSCTSPQGSLVPQITICYGLQYSPPMQYFLQGKTWYEDIAIMHLTK
jgi:hypothetical protein